MFLSANEFPIPLPQFGATAYPAFPWAFATFTTNENGESGLITETISLTESLCGASIVAQAFLIDVNAQGFVAFTDALRLTLGSFDLPAAGDPPATPTLDPFPEITTSPTVTISGSAPGADSSSSTGPPEWSSRR